METAKACVRCPQCLSVGFFIAPKEEVGHKQLGSCFNGCGGKLELMGTVRERHLVQTELRTPCDERCTTAPGPKCSCACGGKNHGTGLLVEYEVGRGAVPRGEPDAGALKRGMEWAALLEQLNVAVRARYGGVFQRKAAGEWLPDFGVFLEGRRWQESILSLRKLRTHAGRMKKATEFRDQLQHRAAKVS